MKELILDALSRSDLPGTLARQAEVGDDETIGGVITTSRAALEHRLI